MSEVKNVVILDKGKLEINYLELKKRKVSCDVLGHVFDEIEEGNELDKHLDKQSVLDVGTGSGWLAIVAAKYYGYPVISIDNDQHNIVLARANAKKYGVKDTITFRRIDATRIPYPKNYIKLHNKNIVNISKLWEFLCNISSEISIKESKYTNLINCVK